MSTITKDGVLFNMFDVSIQQQEVSTAMYKLLDKIKFETIEEMLESIFYSYDEY